MKSTAKIYGSPEQEQIVNIEYEGYSVDKWFGDRSNYYVNFVKLSEPLKFRPSDLNQDLEFAIAEALSIPVCDVRIECQPEYQIKQTIIQISKSYATNMLFI